AMGLYNGLYRLGSLVGMLLGGLLVPVLGLPALALSFAFLALLGLPLLVKGFDLPENPAGHARTSAATAATSVARRPPPRGLVILSGFATALLIQGVLAATLSALIARSFGTEVSLLGLALSAAGLSGIIQALRWSWEPWLAGRFGAWSDGPRGRRRFYVAALLVGAMGFGLLSSRLPILAWLAIALLVMLVATALTTLTDALAADVACAGDVVGFMTRYSIVQDLGAALGPALAFLLLERPGGFAWLYWGGSLAFLVLALLWLRRGDSQTGLLTIR
ncbi:MFS transporter, partial [Pseudomonas aeruginosa]|nr:MFS transporter [Pseudomonas aeruginosa]